MSHILTNLPPLSRPRFQLALPARWLHILLITLASLLLHTHSANASVQSPTKVSRILVLGDSLSAAYGLPLEQGWVNLLRQELGKGYDIINASISGETTGGGLRALPRLLQQHDPDIVIIELGANDGLRGFPIAHMRSNLAQMIELARAHHARVMLVGMHIPPNYGPAYTEAFHQTYVDLAGQYELPLLPFLLDNVALDDRLMQDDRLHPTAEAQPLIKQNVLKVLQPVIE